MLCKTFIVCRDVGTALVPIGKTSVTEIEAATPSSFGRQSADDFVGVGALVAAVGFVMMVLELVRCAEDIFA